MGYLLLKCVHLLLSLFNALHQQRLERYWRWQLLLVALLPIRLDLLLDAAGRLLEKTLGHFLHEGPWVTGWLHARRKTRNIRCVIHVYLLHDGLRMQVKVRLVGGHDLNFLLHETERRSPTSLVLPSRIGAKAIPEPPFNLLCTS